jgi:hypothetical protein
MATLDEYFEQFLRERIYLHNVTPKTADFYRTAWGAWSIPSQANIPLISSWEELQAEANRLGLDAAAASASCRADCAEQISVAQQPAGAITY